MPPRKSTGDTTTSLTTSTNPSQPTDPSDPPLPTTKPSRASLSNSNTLAVEDLSLPRSMIQRLAKGVLPANTQVQKDALLALCKSATVFVSYLANSANDRAVLANKKTVRPEDVLEALAELEFEGFVGRCERELSKYNTIQCTKRNDYRRRVKQDAKGADGSVTNASDADALDTSVTASMLASMANGGDADISMTNGHSRDFDGEPVAKKMRVGANGNGMNGHGDETDVEDELQEAEDEVDEDDEEDEDEVQEEEDENGVDVGEEDVDRLEDEQRRGLDEDDDSGNDSD